MPASIVLSKDIMPFLKDLSRNNRKEWFLKNKDRFQFCLQSFKEYTEKLLERMQGFDRSISNLRAKDAVYRIYKDVRFSRDKIPYKTNFAAFMVPGGKKTGNAGYYLHIEPGGKSLIAGGVYHPPSLVLKELRNHIAENGVHLRKIIAHAKFKKRFGDPALRDETLKTMPRGYYADHPHADLLRYTSYIVFREVPDDIAESPSLFTDVITSYKTLQPFVEFLNDRSSKK